MSSISTVLPRGDAASAPFTLDARYSNKDGLVYLTGIQALVRVLLDRARIDRANGLTTGTLVTGYEGSPLAGYDLELARRERVLTEHGVVHQPGLNEELAATALVGSQLARHVGTLQPDGVAGVWYGKAPGLDRATDAIRHGNLIGADPRGGVLALVGDDPSAKSSSTPCASELALADLQLPTFYPADSQDILDYGRHAIELSRASGLWTAMKVVTNVADGAATATVESSWRPPDLTDVAGAYAHQPNGRVLGANLAALERGMHEVRLPLAIEYARRAGINRVMGATAGARIGIVAAGKTYLDVKQALGMLGLDDATPGIRLLKLGMVHPVDPSIVTEFADGLAEIVVVEEKRSFIETAVKEILYGAGAPPVHGKRGPDGAVLLPAIGELDPDIVARALARRLRAHIALPVQQAAPRMPSRIELPFVTRTPYFCSGCPHNASTKVPDGSLVGAGIGCHAMVLLMPSDQVGTVTGMTQMGGEGGHWLGITPFVAEQHFVQNMGDGTFAHSGSLMIRAAVAAGANITFKLLYNSAVAMTGGQEVVGALPVERIASLLQTEGVRKVVVTTEQPKRLRGRLPRGVQVRPREELLAVQEELATTPGVTVLIHDQECAAETRRKRRRGKLATPATKIMINERVCEGCGDCGQKSNCLSVQRVATEFGGRTRIDQSSCNLDYSCVSGDCPSFVAVIPGQEQAGPRPVVLGELPEPDRRFSAENFTMRITGIGGTGVVTLSQLLATAAVLGGREVRTLDQTGLAQKGGAVVSDVKISSTRVEQAAKLARGECDLYLSCDSLTALDPANLAAASPARTVSVVSTSEVPTGRMVRDTALGYPDSERVRSRLGEASRDARYLDARWLAKEFLGDEQYANVVMAGAAYQIGALPLDAWAIEHAIELNGVAVAANQKAFRLGRQVVADPDVLRPPAAAPPEPAPEATAVLDLVNASAGTELARLLSVRVPELVAYQNIRYAQQYATVVERVRAAEAEVASGSAALAEAVARNLFTLMAYKDEYEVARLSLDPALEAAVVAEFGQGARFSYRMHPPVLRALGMRKKINLGRWARPLLRVLRRMRSLRGTAWDPFGRTEVRRVERELVAEYLAAVDHALAVLTGGNHQAVVAMAELPDLVRGYEDVKLRAVADYRRLLTEALRALGRVSGESKG